MGTYVFTHELGSGAFGTVYAGEYQDRYGLRKPVVAKFLHLSAEDTEPDMLANFQARLRDEARALALIDHRAVVRLDRLLDVNGYPVIVMERINGCDLRRVLGRGAVPPRVVAEILAELCGALRAGLETRGPDGRPLGCVHRDIKPANIMITLAGRVALIDYGIAAGNYRRDGATALLDTATRQVGALGSRGYAAPERQMLNENGLVSASDPSADVYSLGVTALELLLGRTMGQVLLDRMHHDQRRDSTLRLAANHGAPQGLTELLAGMMAFRVTDRPTAAQCERAALLVRDAMADAIGLHEWAGLGLPAPETGRPLPSPVAHEESSQRPPAPTADTAASLPMVFSAAASALLVALVGSLGLAYALPTVRPSTEECPGERQPLSSSEDGGMLTEPMSPPEAGQASIMVEDLEPEREARPLTAMDAVSERGQSSPSRGQVLQPRRTSEATKAADDPMKGGTAAGSKSTGPTYSAVDLTIAKEASSFAVRAECGNLTESRYLPVSALPTTTAQDCSIFATFHDQPETLAGRFEIAAGEQRPVLVSCSARFLRCWRREP